MFKAQNLSSEVLKSTVTPTCVCLFFVNSLKNTASNTFEKHALQYLKLVKQELQISNF